MFTFTATAEGFRVYRDGVLVIEQSFKPGVSGFVPFASQEEAEVEAQAQVAALTAAASRPVPDLDAMPLEIRALYYRR